MIDVMFDWRFCLILLQNLHSQFNAILTNYNAIKYHRIGYVTLHLRENERLLVTPRTNILIRDVMAHLYIAYAIIYFYILRAHTHIMFL